VRSVFPKGRYGVAMDLDDLLRRYFSATELSEVSTDVLASGIEHCQVDLGLEKDRGKRFALWALLFMLGSAPDLGATFENADDRDAARNFMDLLAAGEGKGPRGLDARHKVRLRRSTRTQSGFRREQS
jgi:hypothetical protein